MRFLNALHKPNLLLLSRFLFIIVCFVIFSLLIAKELDGISNSKNIYQTKYHTELLEVPIILFRTILDSNVYITPSSASFDKSSLPAGFDAPKHNIPLKWGKDIVDSSKEDSIWSSYRKLELALSKNNTYLYTSAINPNANATFLPKVLNETLRNNLGKIFVTEFNIYMAKGEEADSETSRKIDSHYKLDLFVIGNPKLLIDAMNSKKPFDLAEIDSGSRIIISSETDVRIEFIKSYKEINSENKPIYDFWFFKQPISESKGNAITIVPRNKPSSDMNGYIVKKEDLYRHSNLIHVVSVIGGILTFILIIYTLLFGQRRLRPWGIIQRYFVRNKILSTMPQFMGGMQSTSQPKFKYDAAIDMEIAYVSNPQKQNTLAQSPRFTRPSSRQASLNGSITPYVPPMIVNRERQQSFAIIPSDDKISELKTILTTQTIKIQDQRAQLEAQVKQLELVSRQLAALGGESCLNNINVMLNELPNDNNGNNLLNYSMVQNDSPFSLSNNFASFETRIADLEAFQHRLGTFYLDFDLFRND